MLLMFILKCLLGLSAVHGRMFLVTNSSKKAMHFFGCLYTILSDIRRSTNKLKQDPMSICWPSFVG